LSISPLVLGGNVFGWTIDEKTSFDVLDAFVDHGFNAIDTADVYSSWAEGNKGGESETIIGNWLKSRPGVREKVVIFTKVGSDLGMPGKKGLSEKWITQAVDESLARLGVDDIDLYFSHWPDATTPYEETLGAYDKLLKAGKIRSIGASNLNAAQLDEALKVAEDRELPSYQVLQPEYNLYDRADFEGDLRDLCVRNDLGVVTYYSLASGFLSGKYRSTDDLAKSARGEDVARYLDARGNRILAALDEVAKRYSAKPAEIALAWVMSAKGVTAPIASATSRRHVESFAKAAQLTLSADDLAKLDV
jgi:aryl-alcohol dehydrogenase-like predicted oxidoreductase